MSEVKSDKGDKRDIETLWDLDEKSDNINFVDQLRLTPNAADLVYFLVYPNYPRKPEEGETMFVDYMLDLITNAGCIMMLFDGISSGNIHVSFLYGYFVYLSNQEISLTIEKGSENDRIRPFYNLFRDLFINTKRASRAETADTICRSLMCSYGKIFSQYGITPFDVFETISKDSRITNLSLKIFEEKFNDLTSYEFMCLRFFVGQFFMDATEETKKKAYADYKTKLNRSFQKIKTRLAEKSGNADIPIPSSSSGGGSATSWVEIVGKGSVKPQNKTTASGDLIPANTPSLPTGKLFYGKRSFKDVCTQCFNIPQGWTRKTENEYSFRGKNVLQKYDTELKAGQRVSVRFYLACLIGLDADQIERIRFDDQFHWTLADTSMGKFKVLDGDKVTYLPNFGTYYSPRNCQYQVIKILGIAFEFNTEKGTVRCFNIPEDRHLKRWMRLERVPVLEDGSVDVGFKRGGEYIKHCSFVDALLILMDFDKTAK